MKDVAAHAGVSVQTVSNVVNGRDRETSPPTRERVLEAVRELGFHPNSVGRALRAQRSRALGFLILDPERHFLSDPMTDMIVAGIADIARDRGYSLLIHAGRPDRAQEELLRAVVQREVDGVVMLLSGPPELRRWYVDRAVELGTQVMLLERDERRLVPSVTAENGRAASALVEHLVACGHERIAFIASEVSWPMIEDRHAGYVEALKRLGLRRDPQLEVFAGAWTPENGAAIARRLLGLRDRPTAIMGGNDLLALGALDTAIELGLAVPGDVAITGFDDFEFAAYTRPRLTTVSVPGYEMGLRAAETLIADLESEAPGSPQQHVLPAELRVRESA